MNRINLRNIGPAILLAVIIFFSACNKTEFLPDPEGEKVPFQSEATKTVDELLAASAAKLYYTAWQKSNIKNILSAKGAKVLFTVFAPDDAAMEAAGLNRSAINAMPVAELDSLMMFYTTVGAVTMEELKSRSDNFMLKSMLQRPGLYVKFYEGNPTGSWTYDLYYYRHYVAVKGDELLINGKSTGKINYSPAINGGLYVIGKTLQRPVKTILEVLKADGRFTMFVESQRLADELYIETMATAMEPLYGYKPSPEEVMQAASGRLFYESGWGINKPIYEGYIGPNITVSTLFAPTDEAFHKAGFQSVADVLKLNERGNVRFDEDYYTPRGGYPMDTVFSYHRNWGRINQSETAGGDKANGNATVFYGNVLSPVLNEYMVNLGGNPPIEYGYKMPFMFSTSNNRVQMQIKGSDYPAATVTETDINTLNGPIHVVDQLFIPKGFKLK
uniref:fasciclin domain-containing protein n=1 Tax=Pedobacter schmidteae TaxID=2201271 RepID=UPI000EB1D22B|nr:fasciclin domain-containing protein [Pedobacter schmidteae]